MWLKETPQQKIDRIHDVWISDVSTSRFEPGTKTCIERHWDRISVFAKDQDEAMAKLKKYATSKYGLAEQEDFRWLIRVPARLTSYVQLI